MKARIPSRTKILNPQARPTIRKMLSRCSEQVMIEVFGWGGSGERLRSLETEIKKTLDKRWFWGYTICIIIHKEQI